MAKPVATWEGASHIGSRDRNEDWWGAELFGNDRFAAVLCDGLGGHSDGQIAARTAGKAALAYIRGNRRHSCKQAALMAVQAASRAVQRARAKHGNDLATTICVLVGSSRAVGWAHVGDSRIYRLNGRKPPTRLTVDHSAAMAMIDERERLTADVRKIPSRNSLISVLGQDDPLIDVAGERISSGERYVLCSDGYWESASEANLFKNLLNESADKAIRYAGYQERRALDNTTYVLVSVTD